MVWLYKKKLTHLSGGRGLFYLFKWFLFAFSALIGVGEQYEYILYCTGRYYCEKFSSKLSGDVIVRFHIKKYIYQLISLCCYEKNNEKTPFLLSYNFLLLENNIYLTVSEQKIICMAESLYIFSIFTCGVTNIK